MPVIRPISVALALAVGLGACDAPDAAEEAGTAPRDSERAADGPERPGARTDTVRIEGLPEPIALRLFRAGDDVPLPFTAYVPEDMEPSIDEGSVHFTARFAGSPEPDAFVHFFVFPPGTDRQTAGAAAKAYKTGRGVPVSQGLEPIAENAGPPPMGWAFEAFRFRYQSGGQWFAGTIGVGEHADRFYQIVRHRPLEYGDGFVPRADLITETWRWADGTGLHDTPPEPPPIVEETPER